MLGGETWTDGRPDSREHAASGVGVPLRRVGQHVLPVGRPALEAGTVDIGSVLAVKEVGDGEAGGRVVVGITGRPGQEGARGGGGLPGEGVGEGGADEIVAPGNDGVVVIGDEDAVEQAGEADSLEDRDGAEGIKSEQEV